jgi:hypothetical protein
MLLCFSFAWGILNLWLYEIQTETQQWTFGQVVAIVILGAPLVSLVESYLTGKFMIIYFVLYAVNNI